MHQIYDIAITNKQFSDLNPVLCGRQNCAGGHSFGPHMREYCLLHYVTAGRGTFYTGGQAYPVMQNQIFIIRPHELTTYTADGKQPWSYIWAGFTGTLAERFSTLSPVVSLTTNLFYEMLECDTLKSCREEYLASKLFALYCLLFEGGNAQSDYVKQASDYIDANYMHDISICDVARIIGVERTYLAKIFKEKKQVSMQDYLINVRLSRAARLLERGYPVAESAAIAGYRDPFNFSKMFKQRYGISPAGYKKRK